MSSSEKDEVKITKLELENYHTNHCLISRKLSEKWDLPDVMKEPLSYHHNSDITMHDDTYIKKLSGLLKMAEHITTTINKLDHHSDHI